MSQQDRADALAPASPRECLRFLKTLPSAPSRLGIALFFGLFSITVIMMNLVSQVLGRVVDIIQGVEIPVLGTGRSAMLGALVVIAVGYLVEVTGRTVGRYLVTSTTRRLSVDLRTSALDSTLGAPVPAVMELGTGNIITRLSKDIDTVVMTISMMGDRLVLTLFMLPLTALMMVFIHPAYALLFIAVSCLLYPFIRGTMRDIPAIANEVSSVEAYRNNVLLDTIRALETLRQFSLKDWAHARMERYSWDTVQAWGDKVPLINRILGQGALAFAVLLLGSVLMSVPMVMWEWLTPGEATAAVLLVMRLEIHVFNILFFAGEIQHSVTSLGRAVALATLESSAGTKELKDTPRLTSAPAITIDHLSYAYPGGARVLDDVSLTLSAGTTTALVGTSGAGKSTLAALVAGLQYPTKGTISLDGIDTATVPNTWITEHVALITQEVHLFSGTLREDLLLAKPDASDEELWQALNTVGLDEHSRWLPQGLDTKIGAGNEEIGAEAEQQLSLARMILRQPPVLIMDEATSEAGSEHAEVLEHAARAVTRGRTALVVAHRLDQAREADRIIVMEQGQIVEDGTHSELMDLGGRYASAYAQWEHGK
ncbi:ABC transporter ATP-binding protein [Corynebacterium aurimucosum]|uniref:ABC-type transport system TetB n=1 Tax=Corynebacterium aurimucosum (strain ATCC 700975 / DSM 44827 / CIP 107346 / CN-1) TaxID=548476 RepID=C3PE86_CORA7|nr:ABC transporter ATP-binding protein [Corynebacterium aurimucosum]ACP31614.1 ABC-type transport system TetB [Corynebacterium aurimucosum ATCC 700975]QQU94154.1 ABC transporter ATP-binding protein [Corynebacterium aurimucosum]